MLFRKYVRMHRKSAFQFKTNLFLLSTSSVLVSISEILAVFLMFSRFESVGGWGFYESALMFGIVTTVYSVVECFGRGFDEFSVLVKNGELDRLLVRPVNLIYQIFGSKIEFSRVGRIILGLTVSIISLASLNIAWTVWKVLVVILTFACGCVVVLGLMMIGAGLSVFTVENLEFVNIMTHGSKELSYYPINIYNKWLARIFTFIIPVACYNYLPISYLMGYGTLPSIVYALSPLYGLIFFIPCLLFFLWCLKKYQGTGT